MTTAHEIMDDVSRAVDGAGDAAGVIRIDGSASAEEVAAVVAALTALSSGRAPDDVSRADTRGGARHWGDPAASVRHRLAPGPGAWQRTFRGG